MSKKLSTLPRLSLDIRLLLDKADKTDKATTFDSSIRGMAYAIDESHPLILTGSNGYLMVHKNDLNALKEDIKWLSEEIERRNRYGN